MSGRSNHHLWLVALVVALISTLSVSMVAAFTYGRNSPLGGSGGVFAKPMIHAKPDSLAQPSGLSPSQIRRAYGLNTSPYAGAGQTIAIVDADDNPNIALDLYMFSAYWGLPLCGAGCFTKVDQNGGTNYPPPASSGWNLEIALDVEWAHALAPGAHILLVEANDGDGPSFFAAERYAGANAGYVLNSWGTPEFAGEAADDSAFADPGVSYFASVPDEAGQTQYPATSPNVVAVGGDQPTAGGVIPWPSSGGGCSAYEIAYPAEAGPSSQAGCAGKQMTPEVTADAAGIPVWDAGSGWWSAGGTSFATVLWGAAAADSGQVVNTSSMYAGSIPLRPVVGGTPLETGLGDLGGAIPVTLGEFFNMLLAQMG